MDSQAAVRGAGPAHRRSGRARRPRAGHRHEQVGPGRSAAPARSKKLREETDHWLPQVKGVPVVARLGPDRRRARPADAGGDRRARGLEQARVDQRAQPLARGRDRGASAAGGVGPPHPARLRDPAEEPAADLRAVLRAAPTRCRTHYQRYLVNSLRETFDLPGTPIRLTLREKANPYAEQEKEAAVSGA